MRIIRAEPPDFLLPIGITSSDYNAMEIWRDMYNEKLTEAAAEAGGIGLADFICDQLTRH